MNQTSVAESKLFDIAVDLFPYKKYRKENISSKRSSSSSLA